MVRLCLYHYVSVRVTCLFRLHVTEPELIYYFALQIENHLVRSAEIEEETRVIAGDRIQIVGRIDAFTALVESWLSDINETFCVKSSRALKVAIAFWTNTNVFRDVL